jgi:hypothetical protein
MDVLSMYVASKDQILLLTLDYETFPLHWFATPVFSLSMASLSPKLLSKLWKWGVGGAPPVWGQPKNGMICFTRMPKQNVHI